MSGAIPVWGKRAGGTAGIVWCLAIVASVALPAWAQSDAVVLFRVNCGGPSLPAADASSPDWAEDSAEDPSPYSNVFDADSATAASGAAISAGPIIPAAAPLELFQTQRWDGIGGEEMSWDFPVGSNGEVLVRLYFTETFAGATEPGDRVFKVALEGLPRLDHFDVFAEAGEHAGLMKWYIVQVGADGNLDIDFRHGAALNPIVAGIEIIGGEGIVELAAASALERAYQQLDVAVEPGRYPLNTTPNGGWFTTGPGNWTSGFYPGALWKCYSTSRDTSWLPAAEEWTEAMESQKYLTAHQDIGFMMLSSYGEGYARTSRPDYRAVLLTSATSLARRYNPTVGCIRASGNMHATTGEYRVIIDGMTNVEILLWAAKHGGQPEWYDMAVSHAQRSMEDLIRPDGGSFQEVFYDTATGVVLRKGTFNGYATNSTWSRGQGWGIYGFTMVYRETGQPQFLDAAQRMADYYIAHVPADHVPPWDFDAPGPNQPRDSSAAALIAAGMLELSTFTADPADSERYRQEARDILKSLCTDAYLSNGIESAGTLLHGTYNKNFNQAIDASLIWGDYYFLEAIERLQHLENPHGDCLRSLPTWQNRLFAGGDGLLRVTFAATADMARTNGFDGLIGLSDGGGAAPADFAAAVHFNTSGTIDVQSNGVYAADAAVPYVAGEAYQFELIVDVPAGAYSVYVRAPGDPWQVLARDYALRGGAGAVTRLDAVGVRATGGTQEVCNLEFVAAASADCDADGDVDLRDAARMQVCQGSAAEGDCACTDLDASGAIDAADLELLTYQWTGPRVIAERPLGGE